MEILIPLSILFATLMYVVFGFVLAFALSTRLLRFVWRLSKVKNGGAGVSPDKDASKAAADEKVQPSSASNDALAASKNVQDEKIGPEKES